MSDLTLEHQRIESLVRQGRKAEAVELIFSLIVENARAKNFPAAYAFREKLFEVDAMALVEIIKSAEIIEDEKGGAIEKRHLEIWRKLYAALMPEEANALYFKLKPAVYDAGAVVFRQGHKNRHLHFIDQGELHLVCREEASERLIRSMGPGTLAGGDTFFNVTVCTTSLLCQSPSRLRTLHHDDYTELRRSMPSLAVKLEEYFSRTTKDHELLKEQEINRRQHPRVRMAGVLHFCVLNAEGAPITEAFRGAISDISVGGISFFIRITHPKLPRMLLGRRVRVEFSVPAEPAEIPVAETGVVIGVIDHLFNNFSVHLRFARELPESLIGQVGSAL